MLLDLDRSVYFSARGSGAVLLNFLVDGTDEDELVAALTAQYDVDESAARQDVKEFVADLDRRGLLAPPVG